MNRRLRESAGDVAIGTGGINTAASTGECSTVALRRRGERQICPGARRGQKPGWFVVGRGRQAGGSHLAGGMESL